MTGRAWRCATVAALAALVAAAPTAAASVSGQVRYEGEVPRFAPIDMGADAGCARKHGDPLLPEVLVLGDGNTMANIYVRVKTGLPDLDLAPPAEAAVLDQRGCRYTPHVLVVRVGQTLRILNSDELLHNVHALPRVNRGFNRAMPPGVDRTEVVFDAPEEPFKVKCDVHPWMAAYVAVSGHPFFDVTSTDGRFEIEGLPPGTYEIEAWHEKLGARSGLVTLAGDDASATLDFTFSRP